MVAEFKIENFLGINRESGATKIHDAQFHTLQNLNNYSKKMLGKMRGSIEDLSSADLRKSAGVDAIHRHYGAGGDNFTLYHCKPTTKALESPTVDLGLAEADGGDLYNGAAVNELQFCYTFIGRGIETNSNGVSRVGWLDKAAGGASLAAKDQPGYQTFTPSSNTKKVIVTAPATFPKWVRGINVFMAVKPTQQREMTYVGTINSVGGTLDVKAFIGPIAAVSDSLPATFLTPPTGKTANGKLKPNVDYYVALSLCVDSDAKQYVASPLAPNGGHSEIYLGASEFHVLNMKGAQDNSIGGFIPGGLSANGATDYYLYVGLKDPREGPMICVGLFRGGDTFLIESIPSDTNAQSCPVNLSAGSVSEARFNNAARLGGGVYTGRHGFLLKKDSDEVVTEVFQNRSEMFQETDDPLTAAAPGPIPLSLNRNYTRHQWLITGSDTIQDDDAAGANPESHLISMDNYNAPEMVSHLGAVFISNGSTIPYQTDGFSMCTIVELFGTIQPQFGRFLQVMKNGLQLAGIQGRSEIYETNALSHRSWVVGGVGMALRFVTVGDAFDGQITALGKFSLSTGDSGPDAFFIAFKKGSTWVGTSVPDPTGGVGAPLDDLSGEIGCISNKTVISTPIGTVFLGSDGVVYVIAGSGEPKSIGRNVKPILEHLPEDDSLARQCSAVHHEGFYKLAYPSSAESTEPDAQLFADLRIGPRNPITWTGPHTGFNIGAQTTFKGENDVRQRIASIANDRETAIMDQKSTFQHLGADIVSIVESKTYRFGSSAHLKRFFGMIVDAYYDSAFEHSLLLEIFSDEDYQQVNKVLSTGGAVWDISDWDSANFSGALFLPIVMNMSSINAVGTGIKFKLTHANNAQFIISAFDLELKQERRRIS